MKYTKNILELQCPNCSQKFIIGDDSIIQRIEDTISFVKEHAAIYAGPEPQELNLPDLAMYGGNIPEEAKRKMIYVIQEIKADLKRGKDRSWRCFKCSSINLYPTIK